MQKRPKIIGKEVDSCFIRSTVINMDVRIFPKKLSGRVVVPPSKSVAHRLIICASFAKGRSVIQNIYPSKDIIATVKAMEAFGAKISLENTRAIVDGIEDCGNISTAVADCNESGSTLRFLIPVAAALGIETTFTGNLKSKLPTRPITPYIEELPKHNVTFEYENRMPFKVRGKLTGGKFKVRGDISSQFVTGLIFAASLLDEDSEIEITSHLESKPYVDITVNAMKSFGVEVCETKKGYYIKGGQKYKPCDLVCEADYSQAAFYYVMNSLGSKIDICGLCEQSAQGDKKIVEICEKIVYNENGGLNPFRLDCSDIPDLVPVLTVLAAFCEGESEIYNVARLRIKESDRLAVISECLNKLGARVEAFEDRLVINGVCELSGGVVDGHNDHRIPMSMAAASVMCNSPLTVLGAECVSKSYPNFWEDFKSVGGDFEII